MSTHTEDPWVFTHHMRVRATQRNIDLAQIEGAITNPEITYAQPNYGPDRAIYQRGDLAVVVAPTTRTVITVLFHTPDNWTDVHTRTGCLKPTLPDAS